MIPTEFVLINASGSVDGGIKVKNGELEKLLDSSPVENLLLVNTGINFIFI